MPSFIRPTFKTAMVAYWFSKRCSACSRFCADSLPIAAIRGRSFRRPWQKLCRNWKPKSSGDRIGRKASRSCHGAGLSNELSHGSIDVVVSPKIGKIYPATPSPFSSSHRSASCCESSAILDNVSGQTLTVFVDPFRINRNGWVGSVERGRRKLYRMVLKIEHLQDFETTALARNRYAIPRSRPP